MPAEFVEVAIPVPLDRTFTYRVPEELRAAAEIGRRVLVPFGKRPAVSGYVVGHPESGDVPGLRDVTAFPDEAPLLAPDVLEVCRFIASYYGCSLGEALSAALPAGVKRKHAAKTVPHAELRVEREAALAAAAALPESRAKQARLLTLLAHADGPAPLADLLRAAHASRSPVDTLVKSGLVRVFGRAPPEDPFGPPPAERSTPPVLTPEQVRAVEAISAATTAGRFATFLLFGITGSGKTEVYLGAIEATIASGRQAIVLVPEIALTPQTVRRFRARFDRVAVLHSAQSEAERRRCWLAAKRGEVDVAIGPRSAVFAPLPRLGLIVVDEEHDTSFKQNRTPRYHARDVAVVRARAAGAAVILGSATPALETWHNARTGKYRMLRLTERLGGGALPPVELVDMGEEMREAKRITHFSRRLRALVSETLDAGGQAMLFLNRRGFATQLLCRRCGEGLMCDRCSVALTFHQRYRMAICHLCGGERQVPENCPACGTPGLLHRGFGTEKVEEEISQLFPRARVARMDSDTMTGRDSHEKVLDRVERGEIDLLVGTQMIAKGLDLKGVVGVGVVDADTSLRLPDFRAAERTFQLIAQVAGRTGRGERGGRVVVQTFRKEQLALVAAAAHDYLAFAEEELMHRELFGYPPFGRLLLVIVSGRKRQAVAERADAAAKILREKLPAETAQVLGPATPPIEKVKDRVRKQLVVKAKSHREIAAAVALLRRTAGRRPAGTELTLDVDPVTLL